MGKSRKLLNRTAVGGLIHAKPSFATGGLIGHMKKRGKGRKTLKRMAVGGLVHAKPSFATGGLIGHMKKRGGKKCRCKK